MQSIGTKNYEHRVKYFTDVIKSECFKSYDNHGIYDNIVLHDIMILFDYNIAQLY